MYNYAFYDFNKSCETCLPIFTYYINFFYTNLIPSVALVKKSNIFAKPYYSIIDRVLLTFENTEPLMSWGIQWHGIFHNN